MNYSVIWVWFRLETLNPSVSKTAHRRTFICSLSHTVPSLVSKALPSSGQRSPRQISMTKGGQLLQSYMTSWAWRCDMMLQDVTSAVIQLTPWCHSCLDEMFIISGQAVKSRPWKCVVAAGVWSVLIPLITAPASSLFRWFEFRAVVYLPESRTDVCHGHSSGMLTDFKDGKNLLWYDYRPPLRCQQWS